MKKEKEIKKGEIIIYKSSQGPGLEVRFEEDTVWLAQKQIAELFEKGVPAINEHIKNIYEEGELSRKSTIRKFRIVQIEGKRRINREIDLYNLDVILSVGYRVSSKQATQFRIWATRILRDYLAKGYAVNEKQLLAAKEKFSELQETISFLQKKSKHKLLAGQEQEILNLLSQYSKSLSLFEKYDKSELKIVKVGKPQFILDYNICSKIINSIKKDLGAKKEAGEMFSQEVGGKFNSIIKNLYQAFGGEDLYVSTEEKAANLLYLTIKDHPFIDGNKRIASFLFIYFLERNNYLYRENGERKINDNALVALALLIAISDPKDKEVMIKIITNLIK